MLVKSSCLSWNELLLGNVYLNVEYVLVDGFKIAFVEFRIKAELIGLGC